MADGPMGILNRIHKMPRFRSSSDLTSVVPTECHVPSAWRHWAGLKHGPRILDGVFGKTPLHKNAKSSRKTVQPEKDRPLGHIEVAAETTTFRRLLGVTTGGHHDDGSPAQAPVAFEFAQDVYSAQPG